MENTITDIKGLIEKELNEFKSIPKNKELFESKNYYLLVHKKEVLNRVLNILNESNL